VCGNLAGGQPFRIQRQHDLVDIGEPPLSFLDDLWLERDLAGGIGDRCLRPGPVAHIRGLSARLAVVFRAPEAFGQFFVERGFQDVLGE